MDPAFDRSKVDRKEKLLVDELKDAVGEQAVERTDLDIDRALKRSSRLGAAFASSRLLLIVFAGAFVVVAVVAAFAFESWVVLPVALALHALIAAVVIGSALVLTTEIEKPAPTTEAAVEAEGVADPSAALNDLVEQVTREQEGSRPQRLAGDDADATGPPEQDMANAAARQEASRPLQAPRREPSEA